MRRPAAHLVLMLALVLVSTSGPFIVMARMDAFAVVVLRMGLSAPLFFLWAAPTGALRIEARHVGRIVAGGLLIAAHFTLWVKAFDLTDYASNLLLLAMQPVLATLLGYHLGERPAAHSILSLLLAVAGLLVIAGGDFALGPRALLGDLMCVLGDLAIALFYVVARDARARTPLPAFMGAVFAVGALAAAPLLWLGGARVTGYPASAWLWLGGIVVLTTIGGHGLMNLAARHVPLFTLNIVIVLEPAIAILLGALMFGATVTPLQVGGGLLLGASVFVGLRTEVRTAPAGAR